MKVIIIIFLFLVSLSIITAFLPTAEVSTKKEIAGKQIEGPFSQPDWKKIFVPETPLIEIVIRGSVTYLAIFILLRVVLKREAGTLGMTDLLVVVMLADAIQNGMSDDYHSVTDGILLVCTILLWSHFLNYLGFHFPWIQKLIHPPALLLVKNGVLIKKNLRKEFITEDELMSQVREQGVASLKEVKEAYMEMDGRISVISNTKDTSTNKKVIA
ncbi:DUF421 domain-containing protein [Chryseosolibacter indicus]|uniref:DUF421 domain-containing protein n=1 Tax=Chryseosolibacter indicus TaxID=2782351 RepID=A0ABS5VS85_9BACT|nr:YetF domain-containing protein [Chryseosolibacter indicus]MBT1702871.1 DUF421 domain-containing protein [Chryseosolibacter indicus]